MSSPDVVLYQDPKSILVVGERGRLRQLFTPFKVQCVQAVDKVPLNSFVYVDAVLMHKKHVLLYWINGNPYPYHFFRVKVTW